MNRIRYGAGLAPLLLLSSSFVASAQETPVVTSPEMCSAISAENVEQCCEAIERGAFGLPVTTETQALCALTAEEQAAFFAGSLSIDEQGLVSRGVPTAAQTPAGAPQALGPDGKPVGNPGTEQAKGGVEVGHAGEQPGPGDWGGGSRGKGDVQGGAGSTAGASGGANASGAVGGGGQGHGPGVSGPGGGGQGKGGGQGR